MKSIADGFVALAFFVVVVWLLRLLATWGDGSGDGQ